MAMRRKVTSSTNGSNQATDGRESDAALAPRTLYSAKSQLGAPRRDLMVGGKWSGERSGGIEFVAPRRGLWVARALSSDIARELDLNEADL
jgi:hypothetical protein